MPLLSLKECTLSITFSSLMLLLILRRTCKLPPRGKTYPDFIKDANDEGDTAVATTFSFHRDVEREHAKLYEKALEHMLTAKDSEYYMCSICGLVADGAIPDQCPVCGALREQFRHVA